MTASKSSPPWYNAVSGCVSGAGARLVIAPLDLIRIRLQIEPQKSLLYHVRKVSADSGVLGFFRGNVPATYLWMGYSAIQFSVYARISDALRDRTYNASTTAFCSGGLAGVVATLATYPLDICRTSFAARATDPKSPKTMWEFTLQMYQQQGIRGFFAGVGPGLYGIVPYMGFNFLIYETLVGEKTTINAGMAGAISGGVSKLLVYPLDTIKKRIQVEAFYEGRRPVSMTDCFVSIVREEGPLSLYRGIVPSVIKNMIATSLAFSIYTLTQNALQTIDLQTYSRQENVDDSLQVASGGEGAVTVSKQDNVL